MEEAMKDTIKRIFSRPVQLASYIVMGVSTHHLMPKDPDTMQWLAYIFIYVAMLALGFDSYREGMERGLGIMDALEGKP